jgi:hypothetical protein
MSPPRVTSDVRAFLAERHPRMLDLSLWVRGVVLEAEPDLIERVYRGWDGIGFRHPDGGYVCAIYPREDEVRLLFEHGRRLEDPDGVLEGDGAQTRYASVARPDAALAPVLGRLVTAAVAERLFR